MLSSQGKVHLNISMQSVMSQFSCNQISKSPDSLKPEEINIAFKKYLKKDIILCRIYISLMWRTSFDAWNPLLTISN